jgi:HSP20 family protein
MTSLTRWDPFTEVSPVREMMDRFFGDGYWYNRSQTYTRPLALDMYEAEDEIVVKAALPGYGEKDVDVTLENGSLTIRARKVDSVDDGTNVRWVHRELWSGEYARTIILPNGLQSDKSSATFSDGILTLRVPKAEAARPRQIKINAKAG